MEGGKRKAEKDFFFYMRADDGSRNHYGIGADGGYDSGRRTESGKLVGRL